MSLGSKKTGVGCTISEALSDYIYKNDILSNSNSSFTLNMTVEGGKDVVPLFVGISLKFDSDECTNYFDLINQQNSKWLPLCRPFIEAVKPGACKDCEAALKHKTADLAEENLPITLLDKFHVTLFFFGRHVKGKETPVPESVKNLLNELDPHYKVLYDNLTPYEFAVALFFKKLYKLTFLFEAPALDGKDGGVVTTDVPASDFKFCCVTDVTKDAEDPSLVPIKLNYIVLVPGVVLFGLVTLGKGLVPIPASDDTKKLVNEPETVEYDKRLNKLLIDCEGGASVLVEEFHSTHVSLGTSKGFKPVVSNRICEGLRSYLEYAKDKCIHGKDCLEIFKVSQTATPKKLRHEDLRSLNVPCSGPSKFRDVRPEFVAALPLLLEELKVKKGTFGAEVSDSVRVDSDEATCVSSFLENFTLPGSNVPRFVSKEVDGDKVYKDTLCFVADDGRWTYFKKLPVVLDHGKEDLKFLLDVYVIPVDRVFNGRITFYS